MLSSSYYPLKDKATLAEDTAGPYVSGIIWEQGVSDLGICQIHD